MQLKYVGPKPLISHTGIEFDNNKEDKYVYLNILVQLIKALDHDYFENKVYTYNAQTQRLDHNELYAQLKNYCPDLDKLIEQRAKEVSQDIDKQIENASQNKILDEESIEVLRTNIKIMKTYMIQRAINKSVYYCGINKLAELVKKDHIDHIIAPMFQKFAHVLHSVQGVLKEQKFPIDTKLEIYEENGQLLVKLQAINILDEAKSTTPIKVLR
jgi:hypothetical protein